MRYEVVLAHNRYKSTGVCAKQERYSIYFVWISRTVGVGTRYTSTSPSKLWWSYSVHFSFLRFPRVAVRMRSRGHKRKSRVIVVWSWVRWVPDRSADLGTFGTNRRPNFHLDQHTKNPSSPVCQRSDNQLIASGEFLFCRNIVSVQKNGRKDAIFELDSSKKVWMYLTCLFL